MSDKVNPVSYVEQWKIDKAKRKAAEQAEKQKAAEQKAEKPAKKTKGDEENTPL